MSDIFIKEIQFHNYRQYGNLSIRFDSKNDSNMTIIVAKNGTGKTTFLNAITWCLYDKEYHIGDESKALMRLNTDVYIKSVDHEHNEVSVKFIIADGEKTIEFYRKQLFVTRLSADEKKDYVTFRSELSVTTQDSYSNARTFKGEDAELIVRKYFDEAIKDYYFFDGEELKSFFSERNSRYIKEAIKTISQVTLMENVITRVDNLITDYRIKLASKIPSVDKLQEKYKSIDNEIELKRLSISTDEENIKKLEEQKKDIDKTLSEYRPVRKIQEDRIRYERELDEITEKLKDLKTRRSNFIREYMVLLKLYPRMKSILKYIEEKEKKGDLPPVIDPALIRHLIDILKNNHNQSCRCPMCNSEINASGAKYLEELLSKQTVSSETSNFLKEIKGSLQKAIADALKYRRKKDDIFKQESELTEKMLQIENDLADANHFLINYKDDKKMDIPALEQKRMEIEYTIRNYDSAIRSSRKLIDTMEHEKKELIKDIDKATEKQSKQESMKAKKAVAEMVLNNCQKVFSAITKNMSSEIEHTTKEIFNEMNWKTNTFGDMIIDSRYIISLYNKDGIEMTASLSATEQMALAYSFILAIHKASGQNAPLVIDSPIGRSSDTNRTRIAESLMKISEEKQIIMLFTPDDFTPSIRKMFEGNANIEKLSLSKDEKYVIRENE